MSLLDWIITAVPLLIVFAAAIYSKRYVRSVADFMSANRSAGRYLLCIAGGEMQAGAVVFVASFENFSRAGFSVSWWWRIATPVTLILAISGFVWYRYRETRAMTLAQFFEIRYSRAFRVFAGVLGFLAGILNFGIIPAVGARALVYFLQLPETLPIFSMHLPTYVALMAVFLGITAFIAISGGVITVMIVNTIEGILSQLFYLVVIFAVLSLFSWTQMSEVLTARPPGQSMVNPFDSFGVKDFNIWFVLMNIFAIIYRTGAWQNAGAYASAGLTPHESRMAAILTGWREMAKTAVIVFLALAAITYLHHPDFSQGAAGVHDAVGQISDQQARKQMETPIALAHLLPDGVKGVFCVILLMGIFGGDATHLHSWGSIFVQDILVPLRRKPFGTRTHLTVLRLSILGVACFAFLFGAFFHVVDFINMWWGLTEAIFVGGAGSAIIGGLYWKKGTTAGAWAAFLTGSILSVGGIIAQQISTHVHGVTFPLNGIQIGFFATLVAIAVYVVTSLLTCREEFNLERMLHRGPYAPPAPSASPEEAAKPERKVGWGKVIGIDKDFSRGDKWIAGGLFGWNMLWFGVFVVVSLWNLAAIWPTAWWLKYWHITAISLPIFFAVVTGIWFTWGGIRDMGTLFQRLRDHKTNALDDGTVVGHQNLDETGKK
ncbi:MAG: hypothetical protein WC003_10730 [Terrimicrobiaceae bacterium]